jgi:hypothetical protein
VLIGASLDSAIRQLNSRPLRNTFFRAIPPRYAFDPLGKQRPIGAQRFNQAGGARVLYLAEDQVTCLHEIQAFGWPAQATLIVPVQFDLKAVIDLRDPTSGPAPTQILGERCAAYGGIDGLLFESPALRGKVDLAILEVALTILGSSLLINDPRNSLNDKLP